MLGKYDKIKSIEKENGYDYIKMKAISFKIFFSNYYK